MPEQRGYVDLHCHLLPGVDDGAKGIDDAVAMARALVECGFSDAAPSPHNRPEYADAATAERTRVELERALEAGGVALRLHQNSENHFLDESLFGATPASGLRTLGRGRYLLIEAPYKAPLPALTDQIFRLKLKGLTPLIAHPERCLEFEREGRAAAAVSAGARLQLDIAALIGRYGKGASKIARALLSRGLYSVAATDMHAPTGAGEWIRRSIDALEEEVGARAVEALLRENPAAILRGEALDVPADEGL